MSDDTAKPPALTRPPMELWNEVCTTDPAHTKRINQRGGFTAIDAQYQIKRATEIWGPMGEAWGIRDCKYGYVSENHGGNQMIRECWFEGTFFYPDGTIEISTDMQWRAGDECRKKLRTNAITKALSQLGFNSDVFEGRFDDNAYVAEQRRAHSDGHQQRQTPVQQVNRGQAQQGQSETGLAGAGGAAQNCEMCGQPGRTMKFWEPGSRAPDMECSGQCRETYKGKQRPLRWWSVRKGSDGPYPPQQTPQQAAIQAQMPMDGPPVDAYDDDIPF